MDKDKDRVIEDLKRQVSDLKLKYNAVTAQRDSWKHQADKNLGYFDTCSADRNKLATQNISLKRDNKAKGMVIWGLTLFSLLEAAYIVLH